MIFFPQILASSSSSAGLNYTEHSNYSPMVFIPSITFSSSSLVSFNQPEHIRDYPMILVPLLTGQFEQVNSVALPQTHGKLFYDPYSFNYSVV